MFLARRSRQVTCPKPRSPNSSVNKPQWHATSNTESVVAKSPAMWLIVSINRLLR